MSECNSLHRETPSPLGGEGWELCREFERHAARLHSGIRLQADAHPPRGDEKSASVDCDDFTSTLAPLLRPQAGLRSAADGMPSETPLRPPQGGGGSEQVAL